MSVNNNEEQTTHCGFVAIVGRPNVGKSTLLNALLDKKVSITSHRPQTTRHQVMGIKTQGNFQAVFVDTPGLHTRQKGAMNRLMNKSARASLVDVDAVVFVVDSTQWTEEDDYVLSLLEDVKAPVFCCVNKVDTIKHKERLLPFLATLSLKYPFAQMMPLSAVKGDNLNVLLEQLWPLLPAGPFYFDKNDVTNQTHKVSATEIIREKVMRQIQDEVPYSVTVEIESWETKGDCLHMGAVIWVERQSQKGILIGKGGHQLKSIGQSARLDLEAFLGTKVFLQLWVNVRENWSDDERALRQFGFHDDE